MNRRLVLPTMAVVLTMTLSLVTGCTTTSEQMRQRLQDAVGKLSYRQAVEKFGPPQSAKEEEQVIVAKWILERRVFMSVPIAAIPAGTDYMGYPFSQQWAMELTFDSTTRLLTVWKYKALSLFSKAFYQGCDRPHCRVVES